MTREQEEELRALVAALDGEGADVALAVLSALRDGGMHGGPFARLLGITFTEFGGGRCAATLAVGPHLLNPLGVAHGGVTYALADTVCGGAAFSALKGGRVVTQDMHIRYFGAARPGPLAASAEVIHHGRRTITTTCRVFQEDVLVASVSATFAILNDGEVERLRGE
jgi:uncharacterized protein (TIGR00369 family)